MNKSRSDLMDGSSIKQDKETVFIYNKFTFRIKFRIYLNMLSFVSFFYWIGEFALLKAIVLITNLHLRFPGLTSVQLPSLKEPYNCLVNLWLQSSWNLMPAFSANLFDCKPSFLSYASVKLTMTSVSSFSKLPYTSSIITLSRSLKRQTD